MMRSLLPCVASWLLSSATLVALPQSTTLTNDDIPFDNQKGRYLNFETAPIQPMALSADGTRLYALNQPGSRLAIFDTATMLPIQQIAIGLGAVSVVPRPGTSELWVVDRVSTCVSVIDLGLGAIVRTIRVGAEPHGLAFSDSGDRAYVSCSADDRVDVIRTSTYRVVKEIGIPARNPRGIVYRNGRAYTVSFLSGNNTAPAGTPSDPRAVVAVKTVGGPGVEPLPDRDLFVIPTRATPEEDRLERSLTVSGLGTILFNLHARPGTSELWIPNTEALNSVHRGEVNFVEGQVVQNRITIVDETGAVPPRIVDLDAIAPPHHKCGQPAAIVFDPVSPRAFVCGYGSDIVAVLDLSAGGDPTWAGCIEIHPRQAYPRGTGPRGCVIDASGQWLYVYNKTDRSVTQVDLAQLPWTPDFVITAAPPVTLGFELMSGAERLGRHLFTDCRNSKSLTSSCASCHIDGHTDGLAWDLSHYLDPEGTPDDQLTFGTDVKGPLVTQTIRRMEEAGPYHWRGEKRTLHQFNAAFVNLLEREVNGQPEEMGGDFQYMVHFMNRLAYPANPHQPLDRRYTPQQLQGATVFMTKPILGSLTCSSCHMLPLGGGGEIVAETTGGVIRSADVPLLRGIGEKAVRSFVIGGEYGTRTELGAGLGHGGGLSKLQDLTPPGAPGQTGAHVFDITPQEADQIASFLEALDTGLAPATAFQVTAWAGNVTTLPGGDLSYLIDQAERGHCDLVFYRTPITVSGSWVIRSGMYDTTTHKFATAERKKAQLDVHALMSEAAAGSPVTFLGVPVGMGIPTGLDRDMDRLWDLDERRAGTRYEDGNTDADKYPDGYEIKWGMNPLVPNLTSLDTTAPSVVGPVRLIYATTNTLKFEFDTDEVCQALIGYNGLYPVQRLPLAAFKDMEHWVVLNDLEPDTSYNLQLTLKDPSLNIRVDSSTTLRTKPRALPDPARVRSIDLSVISPPTGGPIVVASVALIAGYSPAAPGYVLHGALYYLTWNGNLELVGDHARSLLDANGVAHFNFPFASPVSSGLGTLVFVLTDVDAPAGNVPYVRGLNLQTTATLPY